MVGELEAQLPRWALLSGASGKSFEDRRDKAIMLEITNRLIDIDLDLQGVRVVGKGGKHHGNPPLTRRRAFRA